MKNLAHGLGAVLCVFGVLSKSAKGQTTLFSGNFDIYTAGTSLVGQGNWKLYEGTNTPTVIADPSAPSKSNDVQFLSPGNSWVYNNSVDQSVEANHIYTFSFDLSLNPIGIFSYQQNVNSSSTSYLFDLDDSKGTILYKSGGTLTKIADHTLIANTFYKFALTYNSTTGEEKLTITNLSDSSILLNNFTLVSPTSGGTVRSLFSPLWATSNGTNGACTLDDFSITDTEAASNSPHTP